MSLIIIIIIIIIIFIFTLNQYNTRKQKNHAHVHPSPSQDTNTAMKPVVTKKRTVIGGACFTPRLPEGRRPKYPSLSVELSRAVIEYIRGPLIGTMLVLLLAPYLDQVRAQFATAPPLQIPLPEGLFGVLSKVKAFSSLLTTNGFLEIPCDERLFFTTCFCVTHSVVYWPMNLTFEIWDSMKLMQEYKLDRKPYQAPKPGVILGTAIHAVVDQLIIAPFAIYFVAYPISKHFGMPDWDTPLPSMLHIWLALVGCKAFNEIAFFWVHRACHHPLIYKHIHKQHHSYIGTVGWAAEHAHPLEVLLADYLPTLGGILFFGPPLLVGLVWFAWRIEQTLEVHSGYCFRGTWLHSIGLTHGTQAAFHDHHHTANQGAFGGMSLLDYLCETQDSFLADEEKRAKKRQEVGEEEQGACVNGIKTD